MKVVVVYKALLLLFILGHKKWVLCAGKNNPSKTGGSAAAAKTSTPSQGNAKSSGGRGTQAQSSDSRKEAELDVSKTNQNFYTYKKEGNLETYTATLGYKFSKVICGSRVLWQPKSSGEFATKVEITRSGGTVTLGNVTLLKNEGYV